MTVFGIGFRVLIFFSADIRWNKNWTADAIVNVLSSSCHCDLSFDGQLCQEYVYQKQGRSDGGYIGIYTPPPKKSVYLKFFVWLFCLLARTS